MRDVIIVGAGPGGLLLAQYFGDHGIDYASFSRDEWATA